MEFIEQALVNLTPSAEWKIKGGVLEWKDSKITQPTQSEIDAEVIRLQVKYDAQEYARSRTAEYPSLKDQQDMQFHDAIDGTTTWQDAIQVIKDKYPKPE
jgi:hypothetical protein